MSGEKQWWSCSTCGHETQASETEVRSGSKMCPACGHLLRLDEDVESHLPGLDETQVIKLREMARMAQDGVDVSVSGEWDTSVRGPSIREDD